MRILPTDITPLNPFLNKIDEWRGSKSVFKRHVLTRVVTLVAGPPLAAVSCLYHTLCFVGKTPIVGLRYTIGMIPVKKEGRWRTIGSFLPDTLGFKDWMKHAYKATAFALDIIFCPLLGSISPSLNIKFHDELDLASTENHRRQYWESHEKYDHILHHIKNGLKETIDGKKDLKELYDQLNKNKLLSLGDKDSEQECLNSLKKAIDCLEGKRKFQNPKMRYKFYKESLRSALQTQHYKNNSGQLPGHTEPFSVTLLNSMSYAEFAKVNVQTFTQSVAMGIASKGKLSRETTAKLDLVQIRKKFGDSVSKQNLKKFHSTIKNNEKFHQKIQGEIRQLGLDPSVQGNPPNVKYKVMDKAGKIITNVRTPTPTDEDCNVNPEFKAFLRYLKANKLKYAMINLQNRKKVQEWKGKAGLNGEHVRSINLEALGNDPEFKGTISVFTFDKNSAFFHQNVKSKQLNKSLQALKGKVDSGKLELLRKVLSKKHHSVEVAEEIKSLAIEAHVDLSQLPFMTSANDFMKSFIAQMANPNSGMHVPEEWKDGDILKASYEKKIGDTLKFLHQNFFAVDHLSPKQRQDFIEISYLFLTDLIIKETKADFYNTSCKDCIDRGGGANWLMLAFMTLLQTYDAKPQGINEVQLQHRIDALSAKLEEDAIWAKNRGIIFERLERAQSAIEQIFTSLESCSSEAVKAAKVKTIREEMYIAQLKMPHDSSQVVQTR